MTEKIVDACVHQWTTDLEAYKEKVPKKWRNRLETKIGYEDSFVGMLVPTLPWHHAYWNEDAPEYETPTGEYTRSAEYRSPTEVERALGDRGVDTALLTGHEIKFVPGLSDVQYQAAILSAYNEVLTERWLDESTLFKGCIAVTPANPSASVEEIQKYADNPDMIGVIIYGGGELALGHEYVHPIYEAAVDADLPVMIHTGGNPINRQTAGGLPTQYVTYDSLLFQDHMTNFASIVFRGVFDEYPDLKVIWAGEGAGWIYHTMLRATRYYRNYGKVVPRELEKEPKEYVRDNCYVTTYPVGQRGAEEVADMYEMVGSSNVLYASGYPHWDSDTTEVLADLPEPLRQEVARENSVQVFDL